MRTFLAVGIESRGMNDGFSESLETGALDSAFAICTSRIPKISPRYLHRHGPAETSKVAVIAVQAHGDVIKILDLGLPPQDARWDMLTSLSSNSAA